MTCRIKLFNFQMIVFEKHYRYTIPYSSSVVITKAINARKFLVGTQCILGLVRLFGRGWDSETFLKCPVKKKTCLKGVTF